jgi:murein tripeptide amidase MpaA
MSAAENPKLVTFIPSIGKTVENRDIFAVKITSGKKPSYGGEKKQVWFNGLQHARYVSFPPNQSILNAIHGLFLVNLPSLCSFFFCF